MGSASSKAKTLSQDLRGKHFVVTGANTGIGYATTRELAKLGAKVTLACRNAERGQQAVEKMKAEALAKPVEEVGRKSESRELLDRLFSLACCCFISKQNPPKLLGQRARSLSCA